MFTQRWRLVFSLMLLLCTMTSCALSEETSGISLNTNERIAVSGAWALYPMMVRWGEEYHDRYPEVEFDISAGGAGKRRPTPAGPGLAGIGPGPRSGAIRAAVALGAGMGAKRVAVTIHGVEITKVR